MRFFPGPTRLVIDELGHLPPSAEAANAVFQVISQRYMEISIILTTNRGVGSSVKSSATPPSPPPPCPTASCTAPSSSTSTGSPTNYANTTPATNNSVTPPRASEHHSSTPHTRWGKSMSNPEDFQRTPST